MVGTMTCQPPSPDVQGRVTHTLARRTKLAAASSNPLTPAAQNQLVGGVFLLMPVVPPTSKHQLKHLGELLTPCISVFSSLRPPSLCPKLGTYLAVA